MTVARVVTDPPAGTLTLTATFAGPVERVYPGAAPRGRVRRGAPAPAVEDDGSRSIPSPTAARS